MRLMEGNMNVRSTLALAVLVSLPPTAAIGQTWEERNACIGDAFTVCGYAIPDRARVAACLAENMHRISPPCRLVMARYNRPGTTRFDSERGQREPRDAADTWDRRQTGFGAERSAPRHGTERPHERDRWSANEPNFWNEPRHHERW